MDFLSLPNYHSWRSRKHNGVVAGVFLFVVVRVLLTTYKWELKSALHLPFEAVWLEYMIFGVLMLLVLIFKPEGLLREKPTMTEPKRGGEEDKKGSVQVAAPVLAARKQA